MSFVTMMEGHLAWGDKPLLDNADLTVEAGQRIGLIRPQRYRQELFT